MESQLKQSQLNSSGVSSGANGTNDSNVAFGVKSGAGGGSNIKNLNVERKGRFNIVHAGPPRACAGSILGGASNQVTTVNSNVTAVKNTSSSPDYMSTPTAPGSPDSNSPSSSNSAIVVPPSYSSIEPIFSNTNAIGSAKPNPATFTNDDSKNPANIGMGLNNKPPSALVAKKKGRFILTTARATENNLQPNGDHKTIQKLHISPSQSIEENDINHQIQLNSSSLSSDINIPPALSSHVFHTSNQAHTSLAESPQIIANPYPMSSMFSSDTANGNGQRLGKLVHLCDQMKNEMLETEKTILILQNELILLRTRNNELEAKCVETERQYMEEKSLRENSDAQLEHLINIIESHRNQQMQSEDNNFEQIPTIKRKAMINKREFVTPRLRGLNATNQAHTSLNHNPISRSLSANGSSNQEGNAMPLSSNNLSHTQTKQPYHSLQTPNPSPLKCNLINQNSSSSRTSLYDPKGNVNIDIAATQQIQLKQPMNSIVRESKKFQIKSSQGSDSTPSTSHTQMTMNNADHYNHNRVISSNRNETKTKNREFKTRDASVARINQATKISVNGSVT